MFHGSRAHHGRRARFFEKGALKYVVLDIISEKPRHGYEVITELEERSGGFYSPSPGAIYPALQLLEDMGHLRLRKEDGKKVYELTEEGKAFLSEHKEKVHHHREHFHGGGHPPSGEGAGLMFELKSTFHEIAHSARRSRGDEKKLEAIRVVLKDTKAKIEEIVGE